MLVIKTCFTFIALASCMGQLHKIWTEGGQCKCPRIVTVTSYSIYPVENFRGKLTKCTERVILKGHNISESPHGALVNLPCLGRLEIKNTRLTEINYGMLNGTNNLLSLTFSSNRISSLQPSSFASLEKLEYLKLDHNNLQTIKIKQFEGLPNLKTLNLNNNELATIDNYSFHNLTALKELYLQNNKLSHIHQYTFRGLVQLKHLGLHNNIIREIEPYSFSSLSKLVTLSLDNNNFSFIDKYTFIRMSNLQRIILSDSLQSIGCGTFGGSYNNMYLEISGEDFPLLTWRVFGGNMNNERKLPDIYVYGSNVSCSKQNCWMKFYYQDYGNFINFNPDKTQKISTKTSATSLPIQTNTLSRCLMFLKSSCPGRGLCNLTVTQCAKKCNTLGYFTGNVTIDDIRCPFQTFCNCTCPQYHSKKNACDEECGGEGLGMQGMDSNECPKCIGCMKCMDCQVDCNTTNKQIENHFNMTKSNFTCKRSCLECYGNQEDKHDILLTAVLAPTGLLFMTGLFIFITWRFLKCNRNSQQEQENQNSRK